MLINFQLRGAYERFDNRIRPPAIRPLAALKYPFYLLGWIGVIAVFFLSIGIVIYVLRFSVNASETGVLQVLYIRTDTALSNTPFVNIVYSSVKDAIKLEENPSLIITEGGWKTEIDKNSNNQDLGLKFTTKFSPEKTTYSLDEPVELKTTAQIVSLKDNSEISFSCNITNGYPDGKITKIIRPDQQPIKLTKDKLEVIPITCAISNEPPFTLTTGENVEEKKVRLDAAYGLKTSAYIPAYIMQAEYLDALEAKGEDPFQNEVNPLLDKNTKQTKSKSENGPMVISIKLDDQQPLTEDVKFSTDETYDLGVKIQKSSYDWIGRLKQINELSIYLPKNFQLVDEKGIFREVDITNDFTQTDFYGDSNFKKYQLTEEELTRLNNQCNLYFGGYINEDCDLLFEKGFILADTKFKVANLDKITLDPKFIRAEVDYDFQSEAYSSFTLVRTI